MKCRNLAWLLAVTAALAVAAGAQNSSESAPLVWGGFQTQGSVTAAYRFTDVKGFQPSFLQLFDLRTGPRLADFNLFLTAQPSAHLFADNFSFTASGLGGDPFPTAQFTLSKRNLYDFRATWRQSYYYWNQNDAFILPGATPGLTPNQNWATVRKFGDSSLTVHATNNLHLVFNYYRTTNDGPVFTTQSPDFLGSPSFWGSFARGNPFLLFEPLQDETNRFSGGFDYAFHDWTFHYSLGYQTFNEAINAANTASPELSIDSGPAANSKEPLLSFAQTETRQFKSPISEFSYAGKMTRDLEYRGDYIFYRFTGPATLVQAFNGIAPGAAANTFLPYSVAESGRVAVSQPEHVLDQGLTYTIKPWWDLDLNYRLERFSSHGAGNFSSLFNGTTSTTSADELDWKNGFQSIDVSMLFTPNSNLLVRPGLHLMRTDIEQSEFGVADPATTLTTKTAWPEVSVFYRPAKIFTLRGDVHSFDNGSSYTAISPHTQVGGHLQGSLTLAGGLSLQSDLKVQTAKLLATGFVSRVRASSTALSFALNAHASFFGGFTYDSEFAAGNILYARGTPPLNNFLRDQTVNRVIQGGLDLGPFDHLGLSLTGNFDHTSGVGEVFAAPPLAPVTPQTVLAEPLHDGPVTWPLITGTIYADLPHAGRLALDLQRTYFVEQILSGNNFSAEMLTLKWTRSF